jgi:hypothetical protein
MASMFSKLCTRRKKTEPASHNKGNVLAQLILSDIGMSAQRSRASLVLLKKDEAGFAGRSDG